MNGYNLIIKKPSSGMGKMYSIPFSSLDYDSITRKKTIQATSIPNLVQRGIPIVHEFPISSCHGLILLSSYDPKKDWAIWNPFTGEFVELPENDNFTGRYNSRCGFGYDKDSSDYKVVMISNDSESFIYSMKSNNWNRIANFRYSSGFDFFTLGNKNYDGVFFDGALHWLTYANDGQEIVSLDLSDEKYRAISMPSDIGSGDTYLDALGGSLLLSCSNFNEGFDVWMLKDGEKGETTWCKLVSLRKMYNVGIYLQNPRVVFYDKGKEQVVILNKDDFMWFDVGNDKGSGTNGISGLMWKTTVEGYGLGDNYSCQVFLPSTVRLNGSDNGSLKRKRTSSSGRFQLKLKTWDFRAPSNFEGQNPSDSEEQDLSDFEDWSD